MNLEHKAIDRELIKEKGIRQLPAYELIVSKQLGEEYFDSGIFIDPKIGKELKEEGIPFLIRILDKSNPSNRENKLGGTIMEIAADLMTKEEYWQRKKQLGEDYKTLSKYELTGERAKQFIEAINDLGNGDPDMDQYEPNLECLRERSKYIFELFKEKPQPSEKVIGGQELSVNVSKNINLDIYFGPVYSGAAVHRLCLQLKDKNGNKLYHVDLTATPETAIEGTSNERLIVGSVQDNCQGTIRHETVTLNLNNTPEAEEGSIVRLEEKEPKKILVPTFRETRKKETHKVSINNKKRNQFSTKNFCQLLNTETIFELRELGYKNGEKFWNIYNQQSPDQKKMIFKEMLLILSINPILGIMFLTDTGLDVLAFGRHLTKKEKDKIMSSKHLNFSPLSNRQNNYQDLDERILANYQSIINFEANCSKSTLFGLFGAIGETMAPKGQEKNYSTHIQIGLNVFTNPEKNMPKLPNIGLRNGLGNEEKEILRVLIENGGMTRKGIQRLLRENNPKKWFSIEEFDKHFKNLVMSGAIETEVRIGNFRDKKKEVRIYGACVSNTRIDQLLFDAGDSKIKNKILKRVYQKLGVSSLETASSLSKKELEDSGILGQILIILNPYILSYLLETQRKIEENPKSNSNVDIF